MPTPPGLLNVISSVVSTDPALVLASGRTVHCITPVALMVRLAFEEFHFRGKPAQPGGIRSFLLRALTGVLLHRRDTRQLPPMSIELLALGVWLAGFYWRAG